MASWPTPVGDTIVRCWAYSKHQIPTLFKHPHNPTVCHSSILTQNQQLPARQAVLHGHQMNIAFGDLLPYWQIVQLFNLILRPKWPFWSRKSTKSWRTYSVTYSSNQRNINKKNECFASNKSFFPRLFFRDEVISQNQFYHYQVANLSISFIVLTKYFTHLDFAKIRDFPSLLGGPGRERRRELSWSKHLLSPHPPFLPPGQSCRLKGPLLLQGDSVQINSPWLGDHLDTWVWSEKHPRVFFFCWGKSTSNCTNQKQKVRFSHFQTIESSMEVAKKKSHPSTRSKTMIFMECLECVV